MTKRYPALLAIAAALLFGAVADADHELTIATFNCEFLTRPKVHMKFDEPFDLSAARREIWDQPGYRDQKFSEAAQAVAKTIVEINADVIGLEEVGNEQDVKELLEEVRKLGLDYPHCVVGRPVEQRTYQNWTTPKRKPGPAYARACGSRSAPTGRRFTCTCCT